MRNLALSALAGLLLTPSALAQGSLSFSVLGDSLVFRTGWDCASVGMDPAAQFQECLTLRLESRFASHLEAPEFDVRSVQGIGGSTCFRRAGDEGLLRRLRGFPTVGGVAFSYQGEERVATLIGINDVSGHGKSPAQTATCLRAAWSFIANSLDATPVVLLYPPMAGSAWGGVSPAQAEINRVALNQAITTAVGEFNLSQQSYGGPLAELIPEVGSNYDPSMDTFEGVHPDPSGAIKIAESLYTYYY